MDYIVTREQCEGNIKGVCEGCGHKLTPIETVDNANRPTFWSGCKRFMCYRSGVEERHFKIARRLVEENILVPYSHMDKSQYEKDEETLKYYYDSQTAGLSHKIALIDKWLGETP